MPSRKPRNRAERRAAERAARKAERLVKVAGKVGVTTRVVVLDRAGRDVTEERTRRDP